MFEDSFPPPSLEDFVDSLEEAVKQGANKDQIAEIVTTAYEGFVGQYRPAIQATPSILSNIGNDLALVLTAFVGLWNSVMESCEFRTEVRRYRRNRARALFDAHQAYRAAGFGRIASTLLTLVDAQSNPLQGQKYNTSKS